MTDTPKGLKPGTCRVCGEETLVDCMGYCGSCFPYDHACDLYKKSLEGDKIGINEWANAAREINQRVGPNAHHVDGSF